jgi:DNA-binding CsgD family transcriptional regulator
MGEQALYDRILRSLHRVAFDATGWPEAAGLIDVACGLKGNGLVFAGGHSQQDVEIYLVQFCFRGQRREDIEQRYLCDYWFRDERIPRLRHLPDSQLVHVGDLYTEAEKRTSATYNEAMRLAGTQDSLDVRLDGPRGTRIVWSLGGPVDARGWATDRTRMIEQLLPHVRQCLLVRHALVEAGAIAESITSLLNVEGTGVIQLDRKGRIVAANDHAAQLLRQRDALADHRGALHAVDPADDVKLQQLLERALPPFGGQAAAGSVAVRRQLTTRRLLVHVNPVGGRPTDLLMRWVAALVLIVDPSRKPRIDAEIVASTLGLTPTESAIAVMLAAGCSLREIASTMGRKRETIRWHLKHIFATLGVSRQADVVRLVLAASAVRLSPR